MSETTREIPDLWSRLAKAQTSRPWWFVLGALVLALASLPLVAQLGLDSDFTALLPEDAPSVRDLEIAEHRYGGGASVALALAGDDEGELEAYARQLGPVLESYGEPVKTVTWTKAHFREFVSHNRALFADLEFLETLRDDLEARVEFEHGEANPLFVALDDTEPPTVEALVERVRTEGEAQLDEIGPRDLYAHPEGGLVVLFIQTTLESSDVAGAEGFLDILDQIQVDHPAPSAVQVHYAGFIPEMLSEHRAIAQELVTATVTTVVLVLLAILIFFRRLRAVPSLGLFLVAPVMMTFAVGELVVDNLNTSTAFLGSIIVGNGINPGILWLARYLEERRGGRGADDALLATHRGVWAGTLTASLAAGVAYTSLILTDFRGFHDFGVIGGVGMVLSWLAAFLVLPVIALLWDRWRPLEKVEPARPIGGENVYGRLFDAVVRSAPRVITVLGLGLGIVSSAIVVHAIQSDPMDYDLSNLRSVREDTQEASGLNARINEFVPRTATGMLTAVLADSPESARRYELSLEAARDAGDATVGPVHSVFDLLPSEQEAKLEVLAELRELIDEIEGRLSAEDRAEVAALLPDDLAALSPEDLPLDVRAPFTENDGTVGRVVATEQGTEDGNWQGEYLVAWTGSLRETATGQHGIDGGSTEASAFFVVGRPPVFADMLATIWRDGPKAVLFSFLATILLVIVAFRTNRQRVLVLASLLLGVAWMGAWMWLAGMRINFLNFLAFPITFGNGVDYGVNVLRRYVEERKESDAAEAVRSSVVGAGGPVALCSLTTIIGYLSLYASANLAINSFGSAMAISEVTCVLAAVVALPAALLWFGARPRPTRAGELAPKAA